MRLLKPIMASSFNITFPLRIVQRFLLLAFCCLGAAFSCWASPRGHVQFERLDIVNERGKGIGIGPVNAIVQDPAGYMWFGGELGLVRYDAHNYVFYHASKNNSHSLSSSYIRDLLIDQEGVLWIATSHGLNRYIAELDRFEAVDDPSVAGGYLSGVVRDISVDSHNRIYAATLKGLVVLDQRSGEFTRYSSENGLSDSSARSVHVDSQDQVWIGTAKGGLSRLDADHQQFRYWRHSSEVANSLPFNAIETLAEDQGGNIWAGTFGGGLAKIDVEQDTVTVYRHDPQDANSIGSNIIRKVFVDRQNRVWVGIDHNGLALFDADTERFAHFSHNPHDPTSIGANSVRSVYEDGVGDLWVGTFPAGVNHASRVKSVFRHLKHDPNNANSLSHNGVLSLLQAQDGTIWIGTEGGLSAYDKRSQTFRHYQHDPTKAGHLRSNAVVSLEDGANGDLWVGTWSGGLYRFDVQAEYFEIFYPDFSKVGSLNSPFVWKVVRDSQNTIWVGTESGGLSRFNRSTKTFTAFTHDPADPYSLSFDYVWTLLNDSQERLWIGTLNGLNLMDKERGRFTRYHHDKNDPQSLSGNRIIALFEDSRGRIWIGTEEDGLNVLEPGGEEFRRLGVEDGLPAPNISSILEDQSGQIWVTTSNGLASISPDDFKMQVFTVNDGLAGNVYNRDAALVDDEGLLYFGSTEGVTIFNPQALSNESTPPKVVINGLKILNRAVAIGGEDGVLTRALSATKRITLDYHHTMFSFDYAALSYHASPLNQYAYKLEGFDEDWHYVGNMRTATYTNIDPGEYTFRVKAANSNGLWNEDGASLRVVVLRPPWLAWWAYLIYLAIFLLLIALAINFKVRRIELEKERRVNAKLLQLDKLKDAFLANTSHELRTPLNGIVGISESLIAGVYGPVGRNVQEKLRTIVFSGRRLSALINDILDFAKLKEQRIQLNTQELNLYDVVALVFELVSPLAQSKNIRLINSVSKHTWIEADNNRLQQILLNLIGNAIKYTHIDNGYVRVFAETDKKWVKVSVEDTGIGVPRENLQWIFDAFNQVVEDDTQPVEGAGLGLAVSKQLVENHGGKLAVNSKVGKGSTFWFTMPVSAKPRSSRTVENSPLFTALKDDDNKQTVHLIEADAPPIPKPEWAQDCTILIVDDDAVNRVVLQGILGLHDYKVLEAKDGSEALRLLRQPHTQVDLVLLDVIMPGMNGFEVCSRIRQEYPAHELPVIFLTAQDVDSVVQRGFKCGANDFVAKPVSKSQLLPRVVICLRQVRMVNQLREQLKEYMREALQAEC